MKTLTIEMEKIASDVCQTLVRQGRCFRVERVATGWLFEVYDDNERPAPGVIVAPGYVAAPERRMPEWGGPDKCDGDHAAITPCSDPECWQL